MAISATDTSTLAQLLLGSSQNEQTVATLTTQETSGYVAPTYAGLGAGAAVSLSLTPQIAEIATVQTTIQTAGTIASVQQTALGQIEQVASQFAATLNSPSMQTGGVSTVASQAQGALQEVANLLDTKLGDTYVFAGKDSRNPPIPSPDQITSSSFFTTIQATVTSLPTNGLALTTAATLAAAMAGAATTPFSATLEASNARSQVDLGPAGQMSVGVLADQNASATSSGVGTTSTGSYMRDILRGLATIGSMTSSIATDPNFQGLVTDTLTGMQGAVSAINGDMGGLGGEQAQMTATGSELSAASDALTKQVSAAENVDLPTVAAELSAANTRLEASFQAIASLQTFSLARLLPAA